MPGITGDDEEEDFGYGRRSTDIPEVPAQRAISNRDIWVAITAQNGNLKRVEEKLADHLKFHEGVLIAARELGERRIKIYGVAIAFAALVISFAALVIGFTHNG